MVKKVTKKKNRRLRRQIRKTMGCLLLASSIIVAALPVPEISARSEQAVERVAVVNHTDNIDLSKFETIDGKVAPREWQSNVPLVGKGEYIYTTADSSLQFAYINYNGEWIAVILGRKINSLPDGSFTIPAQVDGYRTYDVNMTNGGLCAVGQDGNFLYYRVPAKYQYFNTKEGITHTVDDKDINLVFKNPGDKVNNVWYRVYDTEAGKEEEYPANMIEAEKYSPCYQRDLDQWKDIADENLYFQEGTTRAVAFSLPVNNEALPSPTQTPSPSPSETPTPVGAQAPTGTPEVTPAPDGIPTGTPEVTPTAEGAPTETPEGMPTLTPVPTETPVGTATAVPTETPGDGIPEEMPTAGAEATSTPGNTPTASPTEIPTQIPSDDLSSNGFTSLTQPSDTASSQTPAPETDDADGFTSSKAAYRVERVVVANDSLIMAANHQARNLTGGIIQRGGSATVPAYKRVGDAGDQKDKHMRIHNAAVRYIGRQYLTEHSDTGTWTIGDTKNPNGEVTSKNPERGVFAGLGQLVHLITEADSSTGLSALVGIGDYAFYGCTSLQSVDLANGINTIGNGAFEQCLNMSSFTIPRASNLMAFGKDAFSGCRKLKSIVIPTNVRAIGDYCFQDCVALETIEMGGDGTEVALNVIGWKAFENCSSLSSITFPGTFTQTYPTTTGWLISVRKKIIKYPSPGLKGATACSILRYRIPRWILLTMRK